MNIVHEESDVLHILKTLNLYENRAHDPYFNRNILNDFYSGKRHFTFVNVANLDITFGRLLQLLDEGYSSKALRSGHTTDWCDIACNHTGLLDYNNTVARGEKYGTLMLHDQTETDNADLSSGDTIYLPGSKVVNGKRTQLDLFVYKNGVLTACDPGQSYFLPACYFRKEEKCIHLIKLLKERNGQLSGLSFNYESEAIAERMEFFKQYVSWFLDIIRVTKDEFLIANFFRKVVIDGMASEVNFDYNEGRFVLNGKTYSQEELLSLITLSSRLARSEPEAEFICRTTPYPLLHNSLLILFLALCYNFPGWHDKKREVFALHFHWGAIGMAGYPPAKKGYFKTASKTVKKFHSYIKGRPEVKNLFFILMPIFPFLFYADRRDANDFDCLSELFEKIKEVPQVSEVEAQKIIEDITTKWIERSKKDLSAYFLSKFKKKRSILFDGHFFDHTLEAPGTLKDLPYSRISLVVGALFSYFEELNTQSQ